MRKSKKAGANAYTEEIKKAPMKASPGQGKSGTGTGQSEKKRPAIRGQK